MPGYAFDDPWRWLITPEREGSNSFFTNIHCLLRGEYYFVRGCLEIPVIGEDEAFIWGVWVSLSRKNFEREKSLVKDPKRVGEPPRMLAGSAPGYQFTATRLG